MKCLICNQEFPSLFNHLKKHNITNKQYYDQYLCKDQSEKICPLHNINPKCKQFTKFLNLKEGYSKYCSSSCAAYATAEQRKQTMLRKYNVENVSQSEEIKKKKRETWLKNIEENPDFLEEIKQKKVKTLNKNYKNKDIIVKKRQQTNLEKYGHVCSLHNPEVRKKTIETNIRKTGFSHQMKSEKSKQKLKQTIQQKREPVIKDILLKNLNLELLTPFVNNSTILKVKCLKCNRIYETTYFNLYQCPHPCINCYPRNLGFSKQEKEILEYIQILIPSYKIYPNYKITDFDFELDIYIPEKQLAIEYNGLYWHSDKFKSKTYHIDKLLYCEKQGIQLIQIFEDEWLFKQEIVKSRLQSILGCNNIQKIYARNCYIKEINPKVKNEFLEKYHIQGSDRSVVKLGAFYNDELIAVMTFGYGSISKGSQQQKNIWELNRFCSHSNYQIPGIVSKLLTYFKRNYEWKEIFSYADRRWSKGNLYEQLGFNLKSITQPNYWYIKDFQRIHRFNLRKRKDEPKDIPEYILRLQEGYERIWDCGHLKYILENKKINSPNL